MHLTLIVDIAKVMKVVQKHPCRKKKTPALRASCFLGSLTTLLEGPFLKRGYLKTATERSLEKTTFKYDRGDDRLTIIQLFIKEPLLASLHLTVKKDELVYAEAMLKIVGIPQSCITLPS